MTSWWRSSCPATPCSRSHHGVSTRTGIPLWPSRIIHFHSHPDTRIGHLDSVGDRLARAGQPASACGTDHQHTHDRFAFRPVGLAALVDQKTRFSSGLHLDALLVGFFPLHVWHDLGLPSIVVQDMIQALDSRLHRRRSTHSLPHSVSIH